MRLAQFLLPTTIIGICVAVAFLPSFLGPFGAVENLWGRKKPKKKRAEKREGPLFMIYEDMEDGLLAELLLPEIQNQTGMKMVTIHDGDQLGRWKADLYRKLSQDSSITVVLLTEDLMYDPWFEYAMAFCLQKDANSIFLCYDENLSIESLPCYLQDAVATGCKTMSFCTKQLKDPGALNQVAENISNNLVNLNDNVSSIPNLPTELRDVFEYDMFVVQDVEGITSCHQMPCEFANSSKVFCSAVATPGSFIYQACNAAIRSSKNIVFVLTPQMLKHPYFKYQLRLALYHRGPRSITFVVNQNCLNCLPDDGIFRYAIASCRKIY